MPTAPQTTDELYAALQENDERPYGRARTVIAEELVDAAEQFAEPAPLVDALLELQEAYTYGSEPRKSPVVFARLLQLFDEQPDVFDERLRHHMYWRFKWVAGALLSVPEMPLTSLRQWLAEMRDRYEKAGLGLQPYYGQAYHLAAHVGESAEATALAYELWAGRARTQYSDCEACEIRGRALHHLAAGDDERALDIWHPVLTGKESCQEEPATSISHALLPLVRTGRTDDAREAHLFGYRGCRRNPSMAPDVGRHLEFCALTGNEARGLELLAENRTLFSEVDSPSDMLAFLTGVEVLLQRVESLGHGELPAAGFPGRTWTVAALRAEVAGRADDLAARFDARNGTPAHTDRRRIRLERAPLLESLELTLRPRTLDDVAPATSPAAAPRPAAAALPESVTGLVLRARELDEVGHPDAEACWARLAELVAGPGYVHPEDPAVGPLAQLRADLLDEEGAAAREKDDLAGAAARYTESAELYAEAGLPAHAAVARACALLAAAEAPGPAEDRDPADPPSQEAAAEARAAAMTAAHAALTRLQAEAPGLAPHQEARLLRLRSTALGMRLEAQPTQEHTAAAFAEVGLLHDFAAAHDLPGQVCRALLLRASTYAIGGDLATAERELDGLLARLRAEGPDWHLPHALGLRGRIRLGLRDAEAAHAHLSEALREARRWPAYTAYSGTLHGELARACMGLGRHDEALRHLTRSAEVDMRHGSRVDAFCTYSNAARLGLEMGRVEDCIALLDSLLAEPDVTSRELDDRLVAQLRLTRARALRAGDDTKAALAEFLELAAESAAWEDDPGSHAMIAAETAVLLAETGEFARAREALGQALAAHASAPRYEQLSGCLREVARLQAQQQGPDGLDDARAVLADAARIADEARSEGYQAEGRPLDAALAYEHGRVNAYAGRYEESLAALEESLLHLGAPGEDPAIAGEWAEAVRLKGVVEGAYLKRPEKALRSLDPAIARLTELGHEEAAAPLKSLASSLRDEG
ncbi:hypothetical protein [Streptomyces sp. NPDC020983]|uniref:hypothetical protein n=1 Tax=Streptomyces sp. NPDC020983 TaxID=3365106 RepID=UPI00379899E9